MVKVKAPQTGRQSVLALFTFAAVIVVVEEVFVVVFVVPVDGHTHQPDQRTDVDGLVFLARSVF